MNIRKAEEKDFFDLYELGKNTAEFQVSVREVFMDADEFKYGITDPHSVFLVAEENNKIIGFVYAADLDYDKPLKKPTACLIYLTVVPEYRKHGIAQVLYTACEKSLKDDLGITGIYGWANTEGDGAILRFMEKQGFSMGHKYLWIDKEL
jgi:GNAT superfamily N-acetyltransferase